MDRRGMLEAVGVIGSGIALSGCIRSALGMSSSVEGVVEAKSITGMKSDTKYGILLAQRGDLSVEDETYENEFEDWQEVTVDSALERQLQFDYRELHYNVHVKHLSENQQHDVEKGGSLAYRVDRALFNSVSVSDEVTFENAGTDTPRIQRFTDISDN